MNGRKILDELIKLFVVINIVLFVVNYACKGNEYLLSKERMDNIIKLLETDGISVDTELLRKFTPKYSANLMYLGDSVDTRDKVIKSFFGSDLVNVKRYTENSDHDSDRKIPYYALGDEVLAFDNNELIYTNESVVSERSKPTLEQAKSMSIKLLNRIDEKKVLKDYSIEAVDKKNYWQLTYYPTIEGIPILDSYIRFDVYRNGVAKADMYLADVEIRSEGRKDIYAIDLVLFGIEDYMLENKCESIEAISLCYKRTDSEENVLGQQIIPMYKIEIDGLEQPIFVNAYNNQILK